MLLVRLLICVICALLLVCGHARPTEQLLAIIDVNVIPMNQPVVMERQTIVVRAGKIASIGPAHSTPIPENALIIQGAGKYLLPGLADMHVHFVNPDHHEAISLLLIANGVTTVRCMWGTPAVLALRKRIEAGQTLGPRIFTAGPITGGPPAIWSGSRIIETEAQAVRAVADDKAAGYDAVKVYNRLSPNVYQALATAARNQELPLVGHVPENVGLHGVLAARQKSIEHLQGYIRALQENDQPPSRNELFSASSGMLSADRADLRKLPDLVKKTREAGVWNCVTLVVHRNLAGEEERTKQPELKYISPSTLR